MQKIKILCLLSFSSLFLVTCSNDFDLTAPWKEIPVVYAILSPSDTAHYIRVEKAFLDPTVSALTVAKNPDSLYYPEGAISVFLQKKGSTVLSQLYRVDGNKEGYPRDSGIFAQSPNWLYKIKPSQLAGGALAVGSTYTLIIKRADGKPDITGSTIIPGSTTLTSPFPNNAPPKISFVDDKPSVFRWTHDANNVFFGLQLIVPIREETPAGVLVRRDTLVWNIASAITAKPTGTSDFTVTGNDFYSFLVRNIEPTTTLVRRFGVITVQVEGGGREIRDFQLTQSANAGITGAEIVQTYSNLSEGFGIFTAKSRTLTTGFRIQEDTHNAMINNPDPKISGLNFKFL